MIEVMSQVTGAKMKTKVEETQITREKTTKSSSDRVPNNWKYSQDEIKKYPIWAKKQKPLRMNVQS